jgi:energy-coupling factor transporter ATP-binding protein EcfA2
MVDKSSAPTAASARLERLILKGVGPFDDATFEIPPPPAGSSGELVLFEGPNGSGKSTLLEALAVLLGAIEGLPPSDVIAGMSREQSEQLFKTQQAAVFASASPLLPPFTDCLRRFRGDSASIVGHVGEGAKTFELTYSPSSPFAQISPSPLSRFHRDPLATNAGGFGATRKVMADVAAGKKLRLPWAAFAYRGPAAPAKLDTEGPGAIADSPLLGALSFGRWLAGGERLGQLFINLEFERVQALAYSSESGGDKKAAMLADASARRSALDRFERVFSKVLGTKVKIEFSLGLHAPRLLFDGEEVPIDLLGEGLRRTLSWLADLLVRLERIEWEGPPASPLDRPFWLLLDEVDQSLHPTLQMCVLPALRELFPNARIYATTHSPFVIASAGEGYVFPIRPGKGRRVTGRVEPTKLEHGQSLEWVVDEIFKAPSTFVDRETVAALERHKGYVDAIRRQDPINWQDFHQVRAWLNALNDEIRAIVAMREAPARRTIEQHPADAPHETV